MDVSLTVVLVVLTLTILLSFLIWIIRLEKKVYVPAQIFTRL